MKPLLAIAFVATLLAQATPPQLRLAVPPIPPLNTPFGGVVVLNVARDRARTVRDISCVARSSPVPSPRLECVRRGEGTPVDAARWFFVGGVSTYRPSTIPSTHRR